mmetsp:Transcript_48089/g.108020  ORF Transcript_48089/g.108020 Transcript_48089/m.108020 type:complete len:110 (-) Transcript_48089:1255-1584(-)
MTRRRRCRRKRTSAAFAPRVYPGPRKCHKPHKLIAGWRMQKGQGQCSWRSRSRKALILREGPVVRKFAAVAVAKQGASHAVASATIDTRQERIYLCPIPIKKWTARRAA